MMGTKNGGVGLRLFFPADKLLEILWLIQFPGSLRVTITFLSILCVDSLDMGPSENSLYDMVKIVGSDCKHFLLQKTHLK